ncbi:MAG: hypothetical protein QXD13_01020 [Candidatus Pacearchaeota archaeon]
MEKDIARIPKNPDTDIVIRVDDFGGRAGVTIREFVKSERYTGFTKAGTRSSPENFQAFKDAINSITQADLDEAVKSAAAQPKTEYPGKRDFKKKEQTELEEGETAF